MLTSVTDQQATANFTANEAALALLNGNLDRAQALAQQSFADTNEFWVQIYALLVMTWATAAAGDAPAAVAHTEHGLALSETHGRDIVLRSYLLAALSIGRLVLANWS